METTDATDFRVTDGEEPAEADGVVTAWINFDTAVGPRLGPAAPERRGRLDRC